MGLANRIELGFQIERAEVGAGGGQPVSEEATQDLSSCMIPGQHTRKWGPCPLATHGGFSKGSQSGPPPLSQVRPWAGRVTLMLAILETGLLMLGILHNFIDLFST